MKFNFFPFLWKKKYYLTDLKPWDFCWYCWPLRESFLGCASFWSSRCRPGRQNWFYHDGSSRPLPPKPDGNSIIEINQLFLLLCTLFHMVLFTCISDMTCTVKMVWLRLEYSFMLQNNQFYSLIKIIKKKKTLTCDCPQLDSSCLLPTRPVSRQTPQVFTKIKINISIIKSISIKRLNLYFAFNCEEILDVEPTGGSWPSHLKRFLEGAQVEQIDHLFFTQKEDDSHKHEPAYSSVYARPRTQLCAAHYTGRPYTAASLVVDVLYGVIDSWRETHEKRVAWPRYICTAQTANEFRLGISCWFSGRSSSRDSSFCPGRYCVVAAGHHRTL